jgi:hypothetical protein
MHAAHGLSSVPEQVENDLLQLNPVAGNQGELLLELCLQHDPASLQLTQRQGEHLPAGLIQVYRFGRWILLAEEPAQPGDHVGGSVSITNRPASRFPSPLDVGGIGGQHSEAGTGIGDDAGQRLTDLVRYRSGQRAQGRDPGHPGQLGADLA